MLGANRSLPVRLFDALPNDSSVWKCYDIFQGAGILQCYDIFQGAGGHFRVMSRRLCDCKSGLRYCMWPALVGPPLVVETVEGRSILVDGATL